VHLDPPATGTKPLEDAGSVNVPGSSVLRATIARITPSAMHERLRKLDHRVEGFNSLDLDVDRFDPDEQSRAAI
jgi:hypothetical protein